MLAQFYKSILVMPVFFLIILNAGNGYAQGKFDSKLLKSGKYSMACYTIEGGSATEIGTFSFGIQVSGDKLTVNTVMAIYGQEEWKDTAISSLSTFKPIYRSSSTMVKDMVLHFGEEVTGYYLDKKTGKKNQIKETASPYFVDSYTYPFLLSLLPLSSGYSTDILVYEYLPTNSSNVKKAIVEEVKSSTYVSKYTGTHEVWEVTVLEPSTAEKSVNYIDKRTRRLWQIDTWSNGHHISMVDKETDFNSIKSPFDKEATMQMVKGGKSVISGQVFARDFYDNGTVFAKMQVMNIQAKQVAPRGTQVVLIPYNAYFKEWIKVNEAQRKKGREGIALSDDAAQCIKSTTVYDDKGHFEFVNLMPGEYLLYTEFAYEHSYSQTEVVGYTDHYLNGMFQSTTANTVDRNYSTNAGAVIRKVVTVTSPGEKVEVKLKKTRA